MKKRSPPRARTVLAAMAAAFVLIALGTASRAAVPAVPQEAVDTARPGTEAPGAPPPRDVIAPNSARLDSLVAEVASKLRCTVCRNQSVLESTATLSREMQSLIREKLAAGESPEEIKAYFVDKYGEWILLRPEAEGIGLLVYVLPALALVGGGVLVFVLLRRWAREPTPASAHRPPGGGESEARGDGDAGSGVSSDAGFAHLPPEEREWLRQQIGKG